MAEPNLRQPAWACLGGSFDPPHAGHLALAEAALAAGAAQVWWIPAAQSPHKLGQPPGASAAHRLAMVRALTAHEPRFVVATVDLDRPPPSYTADTLRQLTAAHPDTHWAWVVGADQWAAWTRWHDPATLAALAEWWVAARPGVALPARPAQPGLRWRPLAAPLVEVSSAWLRQQLAHNLPTGASLPKAVADIVVRHGLYGAPAPAHPPDE